MLYILVLIDNKYIIINVFIYYVDYWFLFLNMNWNSYWNCYYYVVGNLCVFNFIIFLLGWKKLMKI